MVEMGRRFDDNKILRGAVEQYRFLRKEYPGSKYRFDALFTIGEIYKDDLNDPEEARTTFENFLHRYPRNRLADDARSAVKEIDAEADEMERTAETTAHKPRSNAGGNARGGVSSGADDAESGTETAKAASVRRSALPRVTGVRHWSTPDYTRVAIDVEQEVKFDSQRISHPDRIFFDLRGTKLASTLVGKTFDVDDGFLKKIRVAEFQPGRTRIVLEVDDLARYDAFLLPDPYRLIIDVHGKDGNGKDLQGKRNRASEIAKADAAKTDLTKTDLGRTEAASSKGRSAPETSTAASAESDDDSSAPAMRSSADAKSDGRKAAEESDTDAVAVSKPAPVETDLAPSAAPEATSADSRPSGSAKPQGAGVIKTTVAVKGSNRRIPKTIVKVDADTKIETKVERNAEANVESSVKTNVETSDRAPAKVALAHEKNRPDGTGGGSGEVSDADDTRLAKSDLPSPAKSSSSLHRKKSRSGAAAPDTADLRPGLRETTREARPTAAGDRSLIRALGLKIGKIVIDAGHGGHDTGTIGPNGLLEKDVVLDVAKRLGRLLETRLGAEVIYTRQDDTFIPLETRTAIANRERADLFISIHANSSRDSDARGVETYYLNFTSSPEALEVAARENAVSEKSIHELQDLVKKIALKEKIEESREFAGNVQESLYGGLALRNAGIRNRGIKKAPFIVLIGANMPSILAEISFVSNPTDERKLESSEHRQRIAESLYRGVSKYASGLSGVKVASKIDKPEGQ
ncbi:MAG: N-acetylmuramoyl-L-alanine amidase [Acidobacteriia bacterium]|nr:N-acetylmuramoyl-L-alanine amidase [Terriglobia bacterium]